MNEDASDPNADTEDETSAARPMGLKRQLQRDVQSRFTNESGPSERQRDAALDLGAQRTKGAIDAAKSSASPGDRRLQPS